MAAKPLAPKEQYTIGLIRHFPSSGRYPPSIRDIARGCTIIPTPIAGYVLDKLERAGYMGRHRDTSRGIKLLDSTQDSGKLAYVPIYWGRSLPLSPLLRLIPRQQTLP